jgi:hypothetical protein
MNRVHGILILMLILSAVLCLSAVADVPKLINYQGRLTDAGGDPVADSTLSIVFTIYDAPAGGTNLWSETQSVTTDAAGLFYVLLGSSTPIPDSAFKGTDRYLGTKITTELNEMTPRLKLGSVPFSYEFDDSGPDSVVSSFTGIIGSSFLGKASGTSTSSITGISGITGFARNYSTGAANGGSFIADSVGTGDHVGVRGEGLSNNSASTFGCRGTGWSTSTGAAYGGNFTAAYLGTGTHTGVLANAFTNINAGNTSVGVNAYAEPSNSGTAYGGYFDVDTVGFGVHYGIYAREEAGGSGAAVYADGDFVASGTKSAVLKTSQGDRLFYAVESPEVWFEDFGEGQLVNGKAHINLDQLFLETVTINASNAMKVFVQLTSGSPMDVVVQKGTTGFDLVTLDNTSNATFDYRVVAKRKGYESERSRATTVGEDDPNLHPEAWEKIKNERQDRRARMELDREKLPEVPNPIENER